MIGTWSPGQLHLAMLKDGSGVAVVAREDVRGYDVKDRENAKVGEVDDVVVDSETGRVRMLQIGAGGILGVGRGHHLVPVNLVESMAGSTIFLTTTKPRIERAPTWGDIAGEAYLSELYDHYGCQPFWSEGYREPDWARSD